MIFCGDELRKRATGGDIETIIVAFTDHYGRLIGKRFDAEVFVLHATIRAIAGQRETSRRRRLRWTLRPLPRFACRGTNVDDARVCRRREGKNAFGKVCIDAQLVGGDAGDAHAVRKSIQAKQNLE